MGRMVTKAPRRVKQYGEHMIGYIKGTYKMALCYGPCGESAEDDGLTFSRSMQRLEVHSDASFAPAGGRGHQGPIAMYGGAPAQWESKQQAFATLSTAESEFLGYTDGMTLGDSVASVVNILEEGGLNEKVLYGDSLSGLRILEAPDGPWRIRHLRLRCFVLRERMAWGIWKGRHVPGTQLDSDLLTKAIVSLAAWRKFYRFMGLQGDGDQLDGGLQGSMKAIRVAVLGTMAALGMMIAMPAIPKVAKVASAAGLAALAVWYEQKKGPESHKNTAKKDPKRARRKTIGPSRAADLRAGAPTEETATQLSARRHGQLRSEFNQPPHAGNDDLWISMTSGWIVRVTKLADEEAVEGEAGSDDGEFSLITEQVEESQPDSDPHAEEGEGDEHHPDEVSDM
eukprot:s889_g12.t1